VNPTLGRWGKFGLGTYFWALVLFLYTPLVVLLVFGYFSKRALRHEE